MIFFEKMKKVLFFVLFLMISGTALVNAQVRFGADKPPAKGAVLDLKSAPGYSRAFIVWDKSKWVKIN